MNPASEAPTALDFGRYRVLSHRRELLADNRPVVLGGRAFDVLMALIEARGAVVSKDALIQRVWPRRIVEENNLQAQISALRRVFAADRDLIRTIAGRGYQFTGEIRTASVGSDAQASAAMPMPMPHRAPTNLPERVSELIGRDAELTEILDLSTSHRVVTLAGAGGIGKTRLAIEAARQLLPKFADGVWLAELGPLSDPGLVPVAVAAALGIEVSGDLSSTERVAKALGAKRLLLVLDNCEHVVDAAARMTEALLHANPETRLITTSRDALRVDGEWIYAVPPLAVPTDLTRDSENLVRYGAVRLFIERARAGMSHFSPNQRAVTTIAAICRRLDGIPLAIELAAARAGALDIEELASRLDNRFELLTGGRRTAIPRQRTLRATLDWSYNLLPEIERQILRRLSVFSGSCTLEAARLVMSSAEITSSGVIDAVINLVGKSLVTADVGGSDSRYRMLETTRAYATEKLTESGDSEATARRHAEYFRDLFERAAAEFGTRPADEWLTAYGLDIDNVRAALAWASSPSGDESINVALTVACVPIWMRLSLFRECLAHVEKALAALDHTAANGPQTEMLLRAAHGLSVMYAHGPVNKTVSSWARVLELAELADDIEYQLQALYGIWLFKLLVSECRSAITIAQQFQRVAERRATMIDLSTANRMMATTLHYLGDQAGACACALRALDAPVSANQHIQTIHYGVDQRVGALVMLSRALWLQGFADQAIHAAQASVDEAARAGHANSLCLALADAASLIAILVGNGVDAEHFGAMLTEHAEKHYLGVWRTYGLAVRGRLISDRGAASDGVVLLRMALADLRDTPLDIRIQVYVVWLAEALGKAGQATEGVATIDKALERAESTEEHWYLAELWRLRGDLLLQAGGSDADLSAAECFARARQWAQEQQVLSWELRATTSLARLWRDHGRGEEARRLLASVYDRFTEGFTTADLKAAKTLLDDLKPFEKDRGH
jgi:predicted ATPase/DNA-binding winged helix-turn-helix (wHTH) protein